MKEIKFQEFIKISEALRYSKLQMRFFFKF
jgi:hypothetical protein